MENIIEFRNVDKYYGKSHVIKDASFCVKKGVICGFIGPNGAGKTTIIKLLLGIIPKDAGLINLGINNNMSINEVGTIVGGPSYYPNLDAYKNMKLVSYMKNIEINKQEIFDLLDIVGLNSIGKKKIRNYSLGMKQRLSIAMSLVGNPKLLIWDEPINGLDPEGIIEVRNLIYSIHEKKKVTFLISSHILNELDKVVDEIIFINKGKIMFNNSFNKFIQDYKCRTLEESYIKCLNGEGVIDSERL